MKPIREPNDFDCLKMKAEIQAKIYDEIKEMSAEERVAYFHIPPEQDLFRKKSKAKQHLVAV